MGSRGSDFDNNGVPKNLKAEDLTFVFYQNDNGHNYNMWELDDNDILKVGFDENGNAYKIDKKGNPIERLKEDPAETLEQIGEGDTLDDAQNNFEENKEQAQAEWENDPWLQIDDNPNNHKKVYW